MLRNVRYYLPLAAVAGIAVAAFLAADAQPAETKEAPGKDVFGLTKLHEYHLELPAKEWETMQLVSGGMRFPGQPPAKPAEKEAEKPADAHKNGAFGMEFPWAHTSFTGGGKTLKNVGLRYKGNASYMASARSLKRNLKVDLDRYEDDQKFQGLKALNLNAGAMDPGRIRESLSFAVFRAAGVPAPRTAYAEVTLTVPDKFDKELLGLYTVIEQVDRTFLKDRFKNGKGLLLKPERLRGLEYLGDDWDKYKDRYQPKHEATKEESQRVIEFLKLLNKGDNETFQKEIGSYLDVDEFLRFVAVNAMLVNLDSYLMLGHNYYIYLNPDTNKLVFIPWDLDLSMGGFFFAGSPEQQADLSLTHPYPGENKLIDRLLAIKEVNEKYHKILKELSETAFSKEQLLKDLDAIEKVTKEPLEREKKAVEARKERTGGGFGPPGGRGMDVRTFLEKRTDAVVAQVAGKSKGYVPAMGFGPAGPGGFGIGNFLAKPLLAALDTDKDGKLTKDELVAGVKKFFKDCDKDGTGSITEKQIADELGRIIPPPPGPAPRGPGAGAQLAGAIVKRADTDKDGKVTLDELVAAAEALFKETDKDKKEKLEEKEVIAAINVLAPPPAFPNFSLGGQVAKPLLETLDADKDGKLTKDELVAGVKKFFKDCDKDGTGTLDEKQINEGLNRILPRPGGFAPRPGAPLAAAIVKRAGDKEGKVKLDELVAAAEALFKDADNEKAGKIDEKQIAAAVNGLVPPPNFGPPPREPKKD